MPNVRFHQKYLPKHCRNFFATPLTPPSPPVPGERAGERGKLARKGNPETAESNPGKKFSHVSVYEVVKRIPRGRIATYGQIAKMIGRCTARMVGYALAALPAGMPVPWHRVINHKGEISPRAGGDGATRQRRLLEKEGIRFDRKGRVDLEKFRWAGKTMGR